MIRDATPDSAQDRPAGLATGWLMAAATLLFHLLTIRGYGYFRDELYYLACARHLDWGYVDHPPLVAAITAAARALFGDSLFAIRLLPAVAAGATVLLTAAIARTLGGSRFAQATAALAALLAPIYLGLFSYLSMNSYDILAWAACFLLVAKILRGGDPRLWLAFGAVAGLGLENKISVLFLGFGLVVGLVASRRFEPFRSRWFWLGGLVAGLLFLPHVLWQVAHGWPTLEFMDNARRFKMVAFAPGDFLAQQALLPGPFALPLWLAGLGFFLFARAGRPFRPFGWAYLAVLAVILGTHGKPYYVAPAYTVLFAGGGVALERWISTWRRPTAAKIAQTAALALLLLGSLPPVPFAKPILSEDTFVRYAAALGRQPATDERHEMGRLPQFFADMHGWPELAASVAQVYRQLPESERSRACILGRNYGQAGAIDLFGPAQGLPAAISPHNSYFLWGPRDCSGETTIAIGYGRDRLEGLFQSLEPAAVFHCADCMPYEDGKTIWVARGPRQPFAGIWRELKSFN
jgi:4-amino-4-deoxy-L-arabinose transferase-like glycosyltransferase